MMKIVGRFMIFACICLAVLCVIAGNLLFDIRASGLVFSAIMATVGMFEAIRFVDSLDEEESESGSDDDI